PRCQDRIEGIAFTRHELDACAKALNLEEPSRSAAGVVGQRSRRISHENNEPFFWSRKEIDQSGEGRLTFCRGLLAEGGHDFEALPVAVIEKRPLLLAEDKVAPG